MEYFDRLLDKVNRVVEIISAGMMVLMVLAIFLQVIFRDVVKSAIPWSEELARYLMVWISFLGAGIAVRRKGHIGVEALARVLSRSGRKGVCILANALSMVFFAGIVLLSARILTVVGPQLSPAMELSMAVPYSAILVGGVLMLLYSLYNFLEAFNGGGGN